MQIKLTRLKIESFKGIKSFEAEFNEDMTVIKGANGTGKTSIYDAFLWLLFGKDSSGRKDFELRPLDKDNKPLKGLVLIVEGEIAFDETTHILHKEHHEKIVKGQTRGYETLCWIDEVPKKVNEYDMFVNENVAEDTFKLLTDLYFFNEKLHWSQRRAALLDIAGEIGTPKGFDELVAKLNGRSIAEYKSVLAEQKKRLTKERDEINPRIDEIQRACDSYVSSDTDQIEKTRKLFLKDVKSLDDQRQKLFSQETMRQQRIENLNNLKGRRSERESQLRNDISGIRHLLDEKTKIETKLSDVKAAISDLQNKISLAQSDTKAAQQVLDRNLKSLEVIRAEYTEVSEAKDSLVCYACGQTLPQAKIYELEKKKQSRLSELTEHGNKYKQMVTDNKTKITGIETTIKETTALLEAENKKLHQGEDYKTKRFAEINSVTNSSQTIPPEQDEWWQNLTAAITWAEKEIGEPASQQLGKIEADRTAINADIEKCNIALASADRNKKDEARIIELEAKEKELSQAISDIDGLSASIDEYNAAQSQMITNAVNKKFKHVEFKLFSQLLNGGYEDCCEAMLNGVPYADMSCGQKIIVGVDIINILSGHYQLSVPLFVDNAESLTYPLESESQTIRLYAQEDVENLTIEKKPVTAKSKTGKKEALFK